jgi:hypothetical protein
MARPPDDDLAAGGMRPTAVGPFSAPQGSTNRTRVIPVPWVDCATCGWRHYPSTSGGRWHIATACANCGGELSIPEIEAPPAPE